MIKDERQAVATRLKPKAKAALDKAALAEIRTVSNLLESIVIEWLIAKGYLKNRD